MVIGVSAVSVYTYSYIPLDSLDWNEAQKMQKAQIHLFSLYGRGHTKEAGLKEEVV